MVAGPKVVAKIFLGPGSTSSGSHLTSTQQMCPLVLRLWEGTLGYLPRFSSELERFGQVLLDQRIGLLGNLVLQLLPRFGGTGGSRFPSLCWFLLWFGLVTPAQLCKGNTRCENQSYSTCNAYNSSLCAFGLTTSWIRSEVAVVPTWYLLAGLQKRYLLSCCWCQVQLPKLLGS
eukprot:3359783-Amphidinium_carterae.1